MFRKRQKKRFLCRKNVRVWHRFRDLVKIFRISDEISKVATALMQFPEKILGSTSLVSRSARRGLIPKIA